MDYFQHQIELELMQKQANNNTLDLLTGKITFNKLKWILPIQIL